MKFNNKIEKMNIVIKFKNKFDIRIKNRRQRKLLKNILVFGSPRFQLKIVF